MAQSDYGFMSRLLHRMALGAPALARTSHDMECRLFPESENVECESPVYIAGLARSGSTILLNALYQAGVFRSLTYRDMPFVLMPGVWNKLVGASRTESKSRERAHGDGLAVEYDSPEAFEEIFWRIFYQDKYVFQDRVIPHHATQTLIDEYRAFVQHVVLSSQSTQQTRYLAKNNNNLLRMPTLQRAFPDAKILIPFRDPHQHAASLLQQHERFSERQRNDRFSIDYMNWLGHWEFGAGHKHYAYSDRVLEFGPESIQYWLDCWNDAYRFALASAPESAVFISYEELCEQPVRVFKRLFECLEIEVDASYTRSVFKLASKHEGTGKVADANLSVAATYTQLQKKHSKVFGS